VGSVNINAEGDIGIYIGEITLWGNGVAGAALDAALEQTDRSELTATIQHGNDASHALFQSRGFVEVDRDNERIYYKYK
ncbi:MAG: GNAT family N-acetyltransferase, partial [Halobacteriaceae archaeon]